jgi:hypothetical protein
VWKKISVGTAKGFIRKLNWGDYTVSGQKDWDILVKYFCKLSKYVDKVSRIFPTKDIKFQLDTVAKDVTTVYRFKIKDWQINLQKVLPFLKVQPAIIKYINKDNQTTEMLDVFFSHPAEEIDKYAGYINLQKISRAQCPLLISCTDERILKYIAKKFNPKTRSSRGVVGGDMVEVDMNKL